MSTPPDITTQLPDKPYARLDYLLGKVPDPVLRSELDREVGKLRMNKKFGLVFEEHLPEHIRLYHLPIIVGSKVVLRDGKGEIVFVVEALSKTKATIRNEIEGDIEEVALGNLVVIKKFGEPIFPSLVPIDSIERSKHKPWHTIINAENFHALQLLLYGYEGKADVIYIDPPYNTGARDWKYNNNYVDSNDHYRHSKWLSMMKRRLILAKRLLKNDGVLICTIDDNEVHYLGALLDELFPGHYHYLITIVINPGGVFRSNFARTNEYAFFIVPKKPDNMMVGIENDLSGGTTELRSLRRAGRNSRRTEPGAAGHAMFFPIYINEKKREIVHIGDSIPLDAKPFFGIVDGLRPIWPIDDQGMHRVWGWGADKARTALKQKLLVLGKYNKKKNTWPIKYIRKKTVELKRKTVWIAPEYNSTLHGSNTIKSIFGDSKNFSYPKSVYAVLDCLKCAVGRKKDALIIDFFAGSGTTLHATCILNTEDEGTRRCILVTNNEVDDDKNKELAAHGIFPSHKKYEQWGIAESVTWPRCKFAVNGKRDDGTELQGEYLNGRKMSNGFQENIQYLRLDYLDPNDIEYREKLNDVLPILWLTAGAAGPYEGLEKEGRWLMAPKSRYAILMQEEHFSAFQKELKQCPDISHVFLVTDAEESYRDMCAALPETVTTKMLYRSYLQNFRINIPRDL